MAITTACTSRWKTAKLEATKKRGTAGGRLRRGIELMRKDRSIQRWSRLFVVCERRSCYRPPIVLLVPCSSAARNPERARPPSPAIWPLLSHKSASESCSWMRICDLLRCTDYSERKRTWVSSAASLVIRTGVPLYVPLDRLAWISCSAGLYLPIHRNFSLPEAWER